MHRTPMTQTTNALHSYTKSTHEHVLTLLYTSVFLKVWFSDLLHQNPLVSILKYIFWRSTLKLWNQNILKITVLNTQ